MDIEKGLEEERKTLLVYRHDFSPLGLSLLDVLCDIVRITKNNKFNGVDVLDITNHIFNYYYDNQAKIVDKEYLNMKVTLLLKEIGHQMILKYLEVFLLKP